MGSSTPSQSTTPTRLNSIQVDRSAFGDCVPLVYGQMRVPFTLLWFGDFVATPHQDNSGGGKGGGGGGGATSFTYSAALAMGLCEGPITGFGTVWADKAMSTLASLGLTAFNGAGGQTPWSWLTSRHLNQAVPYDHHAYVAGASLDLGSSAGIPNLTFEVTGLVPYNVGGGISDCLPSEVANDYLTDANHGAGFPYLDPSVRTVGTNSWRDYCVARGLFISPYETTQRQAKEFVAELMTITNSECVWSAGLLRVTPYADEAVTGNGATYTPNLVPVFAFGDDDFIATEDGDPVTLSRTSSAERFNKVRVEYLDRAAQYNTAISEASDDADIAKNGERVMSTITMHAIRTASVARQVAQLILQRQLYVVNSYAFSVRADFCLLEPLDLVSITDSNLGLANQLVRITSVEDDGSDQINIVAEEMPIGIAHAPLYDWAGSQGFAANYNTPPGSVLTPLMFSAPPLLVGPVGGYEMWLAVAGASTDWGGCTVWISYDNANYKRVGAIRARARYGTLTNALPNHPDPDTADTLAVQVMTADMLLTPATTADADAARSLLYVDGEIMAFRDCALTSPQHYNLAYLRRALYGSVAAGHASGTNFARLDNSIFRLPFDPGDIGKTVYAKFTSFNIYGGAEQDLADVTAYSRNLAAAGVAMGGNAVYTIASAPAIALAATSAGVVSDFSTAVGQLSIFDGYTNVTAQAIVSVAPTGAQNCTGTVNTAANTPVNGQPKGYYQVTALTADNGSLTLRCVYNGVNYDTKVTLTKSRAGANGAAGGTGSTGPAGPQGPPGASGTGDPALSMFLSREVANVFAYADGSVPSFGTVNGQVQVFLGAADVTASCTLSAVGDTGVVGTVNTSDNTPVNTHPKGYYQVTALTTDSGALTITAVYSGTSMSKVFQLAKIKTGYEIVSSFPATFLYEGRLVYYTGDDKLYRYNGSVWTAAVDGADIQAGTVTANAIQAGAITAAKIQSNTITALQIASQAITADELAAGAVTADKLTTGVLISQQSQLGAAVIGTAQIADGVILTAKIGTLQVKSANIDDLTVGTGKITANAVSRVASLILASDVTVTGGNVLYQLTYTPDTESPVRVDVSMILTCGGMDRASNPVNGQWWMTRLVGGVETVVIPTTTVIQTTLADRTNLVGGFLLDDMGSQVTRTYRVYASCPTAFQSASVKAGARSTLLVQEIKK